MRTRNRKVLEQIFRVNRTIRIPQTTSAWHAVICAMASKSAGGSTSTDGHSHRLCFTAATGRLAAIFALSKPLCTSPPKHVPASAYVHSAASLSPRLTNTQSIKKPLRDVLHPSSDSSLTLTSSSSSLTASASSLTSPSSLSSTLTLPSLTALSHSFCSL